MPESVNRRGSSGPTMGAIAGLSGLVAMDGTGYAARRGSAPAGSGDRGSLWEAGERLLHVLLRELDVLELAGEVVVVGRHVEMAVAREVEEDHALLARLLRRVGLLDHRADRVRGLRAGDDALGAREAHRGLERLVLAIGARLHESVLHQAAHDRRVAVVAEAAGVHRG